MGRKMYYAGKDNRKNVDKEDRDRKTGARKMSERRGKEKKRGGRL